jgi:hypothetical protein
MSKNEDIQKLLNKVEKVTKEKKLDLSADEDLSIAIMNLISLEEHFFFTAQKTGKSSYLDMLYEIREMRKSLLKEIVVDYEGEVWCISKHLLAASMRLMEVGTKELGKGDKKKAWELFTKAYNLYSLFWGINLNVVQTDKVKRGNIEEQSIEFIDEKGVKKDSSSVFGKLGTLVQKAIDCCRE